MPDTPVRIGNPSGGTLSPLVMGAVDKERPLLIPTGRRHVCTPREALPEKGWRERSFALYRGTSLIRNRLLPGPYSRAMPRRLRWSHGGGHFLMSEVPLYTVCAKGGRVCVREESYMHARLPTGKGTLAEPNPQSRSNPMYRGTSLIRNSAPLGPYGRTYLEPYGGPKGGRCCL